MYKFDSARESLRFLIKNFNIKELYIPFYLCDVIRHSLILENCKPKFYHIDDNFMPQLTFPDDSYILYPNYFGVCDKNVELLVKRYSKLIVDNAHSYYARPSGFASFNSAKKFLPVKVGSCLWIGNEDNAVLPDRKRRLIFDKYHFEFGATNNLKIELNKDSIPFCYPYLASSISEADELARNLIDSGLTIYRYWNSMPKSFNEYKFYSRLVPIPLD